MNSSGNSNPIVSIIIPVYNNKKYIYKCIDTILKQSYNNIQVIIVNDGSNDGSEDVILERIKLDSRVVYIKQDNMGVSKARNVGIKQATGTYLTFVDGDDYVDTDYILHMVTIAEHEHADMVISGLRFVRSDGTVIKELIPQKYIPKEHEEWAFRIGTVAVHLYRKQLWDDYNIAFYEGERGEDLAVSIFFAAISHPISIVQKAEYNYVQHQSSAMHVNRKNGAFLLPYNSLENTIQKLQHMELVNDPEFHELYVMRALLTMINLSKGASIKQRAQLENYICHILDVYYPNYARNSKTKLFSNLQIPFFQKLAVKILIYSKRFGFLNLLLKVLC